LLAVLAATMAWRRAYRQLPFFFLYVIYGFLAGIGLLLATQFGARSASFKFYAAVQLMYATLGLLAMNESFNKVLRLYFVSKWWFRLLVPGVLLAISSIATWKALFHAPLQAGHWTAIYFSVELAIDYIRTAVFGLFVLLVFFWRARWQQYPFGVMKGFGLFSIIGMLGDLLRSDFGTKMNLFFSYAPSVAYLLACLIWLGAFYKPELAQPRKNPESSPNLDEIQALLDKLTRAIR